MEKQVLMLKTKMLGALLREARTASGLKLKDAADLLGATSGTLSSYEHGRRSISLPELELLAYAFDIPLTHFTSPGAGEPEEGTEFDPKTIITLRQRMIGALLRKQRTELGMSQRALAETVGMTTRALGVYERGERPIPLPELEALAAILGQELEDYVDTEGPVGEWVKTKRAFERFQAMPLDVREFIFLPENEPYLRLAQQLREISVEKLRTLAEALLDLTL